MSTPTPPTERAFIAPRRLPESAPVYALEALPILGDEHLGVSVTNIHPTTAATVLVIGRLWSDRERQVKPFQYELAVAANAGAFQKFQLEPGALLSLRIQTNTGIAPGNLFVEVQLIKGFTGAIAGFAWLLVGYIGFQNHLAWPGSPLAGSLEGPGATRAVAWTVVGLASLRVTVPANRRWRVISSQSQITPIPAGAARIFSVSVDSNGSGAFYAESAFAAAVGTTATVSIAPALVQTTAPLSAMYLLPFPLELELRGGDFLNKTIVNAVAGDAWTGAGVVFVREWYDPF